MSKDKKGLDPKKSKFEGLFDDEKTENQPEAPQFDDQFEEENLDLPSVDSTELEEALPEAISDTELLDKVKELELERRDIFDKFIRAEAEMENLRRRSERELSNAHKYSVEKLLKELLPIVDSLEQSLQLTGNEKDATGLIEGMQLTLKMLLDVLAKFAVKQVKAQGEAFNPDFHEAVATEEESGLASGTVVKVFQTGYTLHDRLIRPAMVIVAK